ncbi:hypothetical protein [Panacibacter ginsenosidivorans]|uniref:hypothetical protein n=1 Tax=Panacibacter ginsenosidivorans TaxID=1813871 RepID=UPI001864022E|nr:hypothetical protein [Panacibacter ginsenosidivorans]
MESLVSVLSSLTLSEFITQFKMTKEGLVSMTTQKTFEPAEVEILHFYRFEGESNPSDNAILYAIETNDGEKGTIVDAYGMYNDVLVTSFMKLVDKIHK